MSPGAAASRRSLRARAGRCWRTGPARRSAAPGRSASLPVRGCSPAAVTGAGCLGRLVVSRPALVRMAGARGARVRVAGVRVARVEVAGAWVPGFRAAEAREAGVAPGEPGRIAGREQRAPAPGPPPTGHEKEL